MTQTHRLRRSELSTPATDENMIVKAAASDADLAFLDLEDSVAPAEKDRARKNVIAGLNELDWGRTARGYRINPVDTPWCHDDLIEVVTWAGQHVDIVIVPKIKAPRDVWFVDDLLSQLEAKLGLTLGGIGIEVLIEEVEALAAVDEIARCSPRLEAVILGMGDLAASQGMRVGHVGAGGDDVWYYARSRLIVAARAAGIDAIDGPHADFEDPRGFVSSAASFAALGGVGKWCIHPGQLAAANEMFAPTQAEIDEAKTAVGAVREAEASGRGAASLGGVMIDAATARSFEVVLERARQCGLLEED